MITAAAMYVAPRLVHLSAVDAAIIVFYFALVLTIGFYLQRRAKTGEDFFMAGREMTAWIAGLSFLSANLGGLELVGLRSAIFNEVLQFILIWAGALLIPILGLVEAGGWSNLKLQIAQNASPAYTHLWSTLGSFHNNPMGIHWTGIVFGLGFVISFGYWTTDFLVVQRVLAAKDLRSAKLAPIIGAAFKMLVPFIVILPGLLGLAVLPMKLTGETMAVATGGHSYNEVLPLMLRSEERRVGKECRSRWAQYQ